jgi:hypothetical protein
MQIKPQFLLTSGTRGSQTYREILVEDRYIKPSIEYPDGSWLHLVNGEVKVATGYFAKEYPSKPSPYWHGGAPFVVIDTSDWKW